MFRVNIRLGAAVSLALLIPAISSSSASAQVSLPDIVGATPGAAAKPPEAPAPAAQPAAAVASPTDVNAEKTSGHAPARSDATHLHDAPGVGLSQAGAVSSPPSVHGMADSRPNIMAGDMKTSAACAPYVHTPMSRADPNAVGEMQVYCGVVPVSKGGNSISGSMVVEPKSPVFASWMPPLPPPPTSMPLAEALAPLAASWPLPGQGYRFGAENQLLATGSISSFFRTNNNGISVVGTANVATDHFALLYTGAWARGTDYHAGGDGPKVLSTDFISEKHGATIAYQNDGHLLSLHGAIENMPYQGFPDNRMDVVGSRGKEADAKYQGTLDGNLLDLRAFWHNTVQKAGFLNDKQPDDMPMETIRTNFGYSAKIDRLLNPDNLVRVGSEFHGQRLNDYWQPIPGGGVMTAIDATTIPFVGSSPMTMAMMTPFTQWNINDGRQDRLGHFAEWESNWTPQWSTSLGVRNEIVWMGAGDAAAYNPLDPAFMNMWVNVRGQDMWIPMLMPNPDATAANLFNARDRSRTDVNFDGTAQVRYRPDDTTSYEAGYSRKTRSPSIYERYDWRIGTMSSSMNNWFGDGNGYVGNIDLKPEVAHTFAVTGSWRAANGDWDAKIAPYYTYVENYIDADRVGAFQFTGPAPPGPYVFYELQFRNHKAMLYGFDASGRFKLAETSEFGRFTATAVVSYVYGRDLDIGNAQNCPPYDQLCYLLASQFNKKGDGLYDIMPLNGRIGLEHKLGGWSNKMEVVLVDSKTHVSVQRNELQTPGYALLNLRTAYEWRNLRIDLAVENVTDRRYFQPLGGMYFSNYKAWTDSPGYNAFSLPGPLPGPGRNFVAGMTVKF